jgi:flagellar biosynthesis protein FliR
VITQSALLVFARTAGFVFKAPGFSHPAVPAPVRAALALAITIGLAPSSERNIRLDAGELVVAATVELATGAAIGYGVAVLYEAGYAGGRVLDDYIGIRGSVPTAAIAGSTGLGRLWSAAFAAAFFLLNGHLAAVAVLAASFARIPPGSALAADGLLRYAVALPTMIVRAALVVAGPPLVLAASIQFALAAVARIVPRFGNFTLPFPIVFAAIILITLASVPVVLPLAGDPARFMAPLAAR